MNIEEAKAMARQLVDGSIKDVTSVRKGYTEEEWNYIVSQISTVILEDYTESLKEY